ncbi:MAG: hypothetical protein ACK5MN_11750 [Lachnospiraceae bacterium]
MAILIVIVLCVSNILPAFADIPEAGWSASEILADSDKDSLYEAVKDLYTIESESLSAENIESWSDGNQSDFSSVDFSEAVYNDAYTSASVSLNITTANEYIKIDKVRLAGYFGSEGVQNTTDSDTATTSYSFEFSAIEWNWSAPRSLYQWKS